MSRFLVALGVCALSVLLAVPAAESKEGVRARLDTPIPLEAAPGDKITIAWTLSANERGGLRPFGASGVFVRLSSASRGKPVKAIGKGGSQGRYVAEVRVPEGGIGGLTIGLEGTRYIAGRAEDADILFPIVNNPFATTDAAARARDVGATPPTVGAGPPFMIWLAVAGALVAIGVLVVIRRTFLRTRRLNPS